MLSGIRTNTTISFCTFNYVSKDLLLIILFIWGLPSTYFRSNFRKIVYQTDDWKINIKPLFKKEIKGLFVNIFAVTISACSPSTFSILFVNIFISIPVSRETFLINAHFLESLSISTNFNSGFFSRAIIWESYSTAINPTLRSHSITFTVRVYINKNKEFRYIEIDYLPSSDELSTRYKWSEEFKSFVRRNAITSAVQE